MTMASTSNTWTRPTRSKIYNPNASVPAIGTNNGSGTGSVVSSATISVMPSLLPASSTNCVRLDPVCAHSTNRLLRGLNSTLPVSDSLGWSLHNFVNRWHMCTPTFPPDSVSGPTLLNNAAVLFTTNEASSSEESVKSWWMAASTNAGGPGSEPSLGSPHSTMGTWVLRLPNSHTSQTVSCTHPANVSGVSLRHANG